MLGGGVFVTQNKVLPGSYINIVSASSSSANLGDRGVVAIALPLAKAAGTVIEITASQFVTDSEEILGKEYSSTDLDPLREIFLHSNKAYVYDLGTENTVSDVLAALEPYDFNVLCAYTSKTEDVTQYIAGVKSWRDDYGKKCQVVVYNATAPNNEGVINVISTVSDKSVPAYALVAWVAGAEAGCNINASCTNMLYDGELTVNLGQSQSELQSMLDAGKFVFHLVYGEVRVLEDINSLTTPGANQNEDFSYNQTIRVIDQIANDLAYIFNTKYLGKIINNAAGRTSLWNDIVTHHKELATMGAIENFSSEKVVVTAGESPRSVIVQDEITVSGTMSQLFMTVYLN